MDALDRRPRQNPTRLTAQAPTRLPAYPLSDSYRRLNHLCIAEAKKIAQQKLAA